MTRQEINSFKRKFPCVAGVRKERGSRQFDDYDLWMKPWTTPEQRQQAIDAFNKMLFASKCDNETTR